MVSRLALVLASALVGCSLVNATSSHTGGVAEDTGPEPGDAGPRDAGPGPGDVGPRDAGPAPDAPPTSPLVRVAHLARDTGAIDVFANGMPLARGPQFRTVVMPAAAPTGTVTFRVERAGTGEVLREEAFETVAGREYTLAFYGDETDPPFDRTLDLLLLDDDASGLDPVRSIRLAVVHVASPVVAGQLVAVMPGGNVLLADDFGFAAVAQLRELPSQAYTVGFDAGADGVVDVNFDLPVLVPGTYANVFVSTRPDDSVFLLVNTRRGATLEIEGY